MISPFTAPGTRVVCIEQIDGPLPTLVIGAIYTIDCITNSDDGEPSVALVETEIWHDKRMFDGWKIWRGRWYWFYTLEDFDLVLCN
jgi:hypothetical protein